MKNEIQYIALGRSTFCGKILAIIFVCLISASAIAQDITSTLASGGKFIVKDSLNNFLTIDQLTSQVNILNTLRLENTTSPSLGVIFMGPDRFIHNYGTNNTFIGINSGNFTMTGHYNTALGYSSLMSNTTGGGNTANGSEALYSNTTGHSNTALGFEALFYSTSGHYNTALGYSSLMSNTTGGSNTGNGSYALHSNTTGNYNTAVGLGSLFVNTTGDNNTAIGFQSLHDNMTGYSNTASGTNALYSNSSGKHNTANGEAALYSNTTGSYNTAIGDNALYSNTTGNYNTALGYNAYISSGTSSNRTCIGYNSGRAYSGSFDNMVEIGNTSVEWIQGQVNWGTYSDGRIKENVSENVPGLAFINKLRPVTYNLNIHKQNEMMYKGIEKQEEWSSKYDIEKIRITGFIAQEVEKVTQEVNYDFSGVCKPENENGLYSLRYSEFVVPLVKAVQELNLKCEELKAENEQLKNQLADIGEIKEQIAEIKTLKAELQEQIKILKASNNNEEIKFTSISNEEVEK
jgi:trimeric autotransporter adhesin